MGLKLRPVRTGDGRRAGVWRGAAGLLALLGVLAFGCSTGPGRARPGFSSPARAIERLDLLLTSVAMDLDGKPGADGFGARVYASNRKSSIGAVIQRGRLEFLMFNGVVRGEELKQESPLRLWAFEWSELKAAMQKTSIGTSYRFALAWGEQKPTVGRITVVVRHVDEDGFAVYSAPGSIPISMK